MSHSVGVTVLLTGAALGVNRIRGSRPPLPPQAPGETPSNGAAAVHLTLYAFNLYGCEVSLLDIMTRHNAILRPWDGGH